MFNRTTGLRGLVRAAATVGLAFGVTLAQLPLPTTAVAATTDRISKSKTAAWDEGAQGDTATVRLNIPNPEQTELDSDVVFVLDKSSCSAETALKSVELVDDLARSVEKSGASVKVGLVAFDGTSHNLVDLAAYDGSDAQKQELSSKLAANSIPASEKVSGTNMQAGLKAADEMLAADASTPANRKYVVLVSDGLTRLWTGDDGQVKDIYYQFSYADQSGTKVVPDELPLKNCVYFGMIDEWRQVRTPDASTYSVPGGDFDAYLAQARAWVAADGDTYAHDFLTYGNDATAKVKNASTGEVDPAFAFIGHTDFANHAMSVDRAVVEAMDQYEKLVDEGYNCYAVNVGTSPFSAAFMGAMNKAAGNQEDLDFDAIKKDVICLVDAGSYVVDEIGADFDVVPDTFKVTLDGQELACTKTGENTYSFGDGQFSVVYNAGEDEAFTWTIDTPIANADKLELSYQVKLVNKSAEAGDHEVPTNKAATIYATDTNGNEISEQFPVPTLVYTVPAEPETKPEAKPEDKPSTGKPAATQTAKPAAATPKTGDATNAAVPMAVAALAGAALVAAKRMRSEH